MRGLISSVCFATSNPAIRPVPSLGWSRPQSMRITVDLPEPFGPRKPKIEPFATLKLTESTALKWPKRLVSPMHSIMTGGELASEDIATVAGVPTLQDYLVTHLTPSPPPTMFGNSTSTDI